MATLLLPTRTDLSHYIVQVELDGALFSLTFHWNEREEYWYLSIADAEGVDVATGIKIVINTPLLRRLVSENRPAGELMALDSATTTGGDPGLNELGGRVVLAYEEASDG